MEMVPLRAAKNTLSALVDRVVGQHERVTITRNGRPAAVLISPEDLDSLEETLEVMSDPAMMSALRQSLAELEGGELLDEAQLREAMQRSRS